MATITVQLTNRSLCCLRHLHKTPFPQNISHLKIVWHQNLLLTVHASLDSLNSLAINITTYCFKLNDGERVYNITMDWYVQKSWPWNEFPALVKYTSDNNTGYFTQMWCITSEYRMQFVLTILHSGWQHAHYSNIISSMLPTVWCILKHIKFIF